MSYINVKQAAELWKLSDRRIRVFCETGAIPGAKKNGRAWLIPEEAVKPFDKRLQRGKIIPDQYTDLFYRIDSKKQEVDRRRPLTFGEVLRLKEEFLIEFTYDSNAIEGSTLTLQETAMVLEGITIDQKPIKEHLEAIGHRDAFLYIESLIKENVVISEKIIKEIHSLVLINRPEDKGVYRKIPVKIIGALHEPVQPYLVPVQMESLIRDYEEMKKTKHIIECVALFHMIFEGIHPFIDGNGRTGRLIINFDLMQNGYPAINIKYLDRKKYYEAFNCYYKKLQDNNGDISKMIELVSGYTEEVLDKYLSMLKN